MLGDSDIPMTLVPIVAILCVFGLPVFAFVVFRVLAHRERIELIRHGMAPNPSGRDWRAARTAYVPGPPPQNEEELSDPRCLLRKGITVAMIGFALLIGLGFIGLHDTGVGYVIHPGPWLLGGLIPLFVGLAQVIIELLSGATLGPPRYAAAPPPNLYGVPTSPPPPPGAAPTYEGSYTYRPGATQELRKPGDVERG